VAKLTPNIMDGIAAAFEQSGGVEYLKELAMRDPPTFCLLLGKLLMAEVKAAQPNKTNTIDLGKAMAEAEARLAKPDHEQ
jgi:hypothetical protein